MKINSHVMLRCTRFVAFIAGLAIPFAACLAGEVMVLAGAASKPPLEEAAEAFKIKTGIRVALHIGSSGSLLNRLRISPYGDIYMPGSPDFMEKAKRFGLVRPESQIIVAYLIPAINVPRGNPRNIRRLIDLTRPGIKVGIGDPLSVCVGLYAIEILKNNQILFKIKENIFAQVESCEKTASLIPLKSVDATVGWREFESWNPREIESILLKPEEIVRISYIPAALTSTGKNTAAAEKFLAFLSSEEGRVYFKKWGYLTTEKEARHFAPEAIIGGEYQLPGGWW